jgi:hypothetical protein
MMQRRTVPRELIADQTPLWSVEKAWRCSGQDARISHLRGFPTPRKKGGWKGLEGLRRFLQGGIGKIRVNGVYYGPAGSRRTERVSDLAEAIRYAMAPRFGACGEGPSSESDADA